MGRSAYLNFRPSGPLGFLRERTLLQAKGDLPLGWFLFFTKSDLRAARRGPVLVTETARALECAARKANTFAPFASPGLRVLVDALLTYVQEAGGGTLTLDARELDAEVDVHRWLLEELARFEAAPGKDRRKSFSRSGSLEIEPRDGLLHAPLAGAFAGWRDDDVDWREEASVAEAATSRVQAPASAARSPRAVSADLHATLAAQLHDAIGEAARRRGDDAALDIPAFGALQIHHVPAAGDVPAHLSFHLIDSADGDRAWQTPAPSSSRSPDEYAREVEGYFRSARERGETLRFLLPHALGRVGHEPAIRIGPGYAEPSLSLVFVLHNQCGMRAYTSWLLQLPTDEARLLAIAPGRS